MDNIYERMIVLQEALLQQLLQSSSNNSAPKDKMMLVQEEPRGPSELIEVLIPAAVTGQMVFPVLQDLQSDSKKIIVIKSLRLVTVGELPFAPVSGLPNAPLAELLKTTVELYAEGWQKAQNIPTVSLNTTFIEASGIPYSKRNTKFANWESFIWNKSKIIYGNGTPSDGTAYAFIFEIEYERFDLNGNVIVGPTT